MICPKCGYKRQLRDNAYTPRNECPACGVVYSKGGYSPYAKGGHAALPITSQKSPVHESSLQQARARVESKLRKQLESRLKDERHQQTLARAKEITAAEVRKRKEQWERSHHPSENGSTSGSDTLKIASDELPNPTHSKAATPEKSLLMNDTAPTKLSAEDTLSEVLPGDFILEDLSVNDTLPAAKKMGRAKRPASPPKPRTSTDTVTKKKNDPSATLSGSTITTLKPLADKTLHAPSSIEFAVVGNSETRINGKASDKAPLDKELADQTADAAMAHTLSQRVQMALSNGLMGALPMVAWLILAAGLIGAVLSWTTIGDVEASVRHGIVTQSQGALPLGLLLGFAYLATGVLGFAFFWVTSMMSRQLKDIRRLLLVQPVRTTTTEK